MTLSVAPDGAVYVAVDEQGSLGRTPGGGRVVRCIDDDGDGKADRVNVFAKMEHPRGVIAQDGKVWVLHPPFLSVFRDEDGDGTSDRQDVLVSGLTTSLIDERGGDHTTNGIRMGLDGWIYIAVGDYGFHGAKGKDGTTLSQRGGGILRVRPDGTELEVFAIGLRNPFAIAIDPYMNLFTRDNTNDGAGWDVRVSHLIQTADYGYSQRFANFPDEIMPPLGAYGQGGGTGALSLHDERWPEAYRGALLTGDWGRSEVYRHDLKPAGATFRAESERLPDASRGRRAWTSAATAGSTWRAGAGARPASTSGRRSASSRASRRPAGAATGRRRPEGGRRWPSSIDGLCGPNAASRFHCQREILRRGRSPETTRALTDLASDRVQAPARARRGPLRAQAARRHRVARRPAEARGRRRRPRVRAPGAGRPQDGARRRRDRARSVAALADPSPRVRAQAVIALGRLGDVAAAAEHHPPDLAPRRLADADEEARERPARPGPGRAPPGHAGAGRRSGRSTPAWTRSTAPIARGPSAPCGRCTSRRPSRGSSRSWPRPVPPRRAATSWRRWCASITARRIIEGSWWGIRPDTTGPYFDPREWESSGRIASVLKAAVLDGDAETATFLRGELARRRVRLEGLAGRRGDRPCPRPRRRSASSSPRPTRRTRTRSAT